MTKNREREDDDEEMDGGNRSRAGLDRAGGSG
jgi:hypothetical protein